LLCEVNQWREMHRKQFSCFSIESLIGSGINGQQPCNTQVADSCKSATGVRTPICRFDGHSSLLDRTRTSYSSRVENGSSSAEGDNPQRQIWTETSLRNRTPIHWSRCLPTAISATGNDPRTSEFQRHLRCGRLHLKCATL